MKRNDYEAVYKVGLEMCDGRVGFTEAMERLASLDIKQSVIGDLLYNTTYLLKGRRYTRTLSIPVTDDYLTWIRRDRGTSALANAIAALEQHIRYYEKLQNCHMRGMRGVLAKHKALLLASRETSIHLEWNDASSRGYFDILPLDLFAKAGLRKGIVHVTRKSPGLD
ncbi:MAG: hypothetical protein R3F03_14235, partial [Opitutaceae bacterium]